MSTRISFISLFILGLPLWFSTACAQKQSSSKDIQRQIVLLHNEEKIIPIQELQQKFTHINIGFPAAATLEQMMQRYAPIQPLNITIQDSLSVLQSKMPSSGTVLFSLGRLNEAQNLKVIQLSQYLKNKGLHSIIISAQSIENLKLFETCKVPIIWSSTMDTLAAPILAQMVFGGKEINGTLQKNEGTFFKKGMGETTHSTRLGYGSLADEGFDPNALNQIDEIANDAISKKASPGMLVLIAKKGVVLFQKAYGNFSYEVNSPKQTLSSLFDLASITKVMATTPVVMKLVDEKKIDLNQKISFYLPELKDKPSATVTVKEVLLHQAGFIPFIPFYKHLKPEDKSQDSSANYPTKVAPHYFLRKNYFQEVMWPTMINSPLKTRGTYVYSDISMYMMRAIIEKITGKTLPELGQTYFYAPLGLQHTEFNPWKIEPIAHITPTEWDQYFRKILLQGYVHDQGAAMAGGVSGHAGLFSTLNDMAIFYQMLLNNGTYGGKKYIDASTIHQFTKRNSNVSRRGLGFDKRDVDSTKGYPSFKADSTIYGHTGYTGTCVWVDPKNELIYIFLSNRVNPSVSNQLSHLKVRERILDLVLDALCNENP